MTKFIFITLLVFISAFYFGSTAPLDTLDDAASGSSTTVGQAPSLPPKPTTQGPTNGGDSSATTTDAGGAPSKHTTFAHGNKPTTTMNPAKPSGSPSSDGDLSPTTTSPTPVPTTSDAASTTSLSIAAIILPIITFSIFKV